MNFEIAPSQVLQGELRPPSDKSISHRALILGALAEGKTRIAGPLLGEDTLATLAAVRAMGVRVKRVGTGLCVTGVGLRGFRAPTAALDMGNAGTGMRLLAGVLCGQAFASELVGDDSLSRRPMQRIVEPLRRMGANIRADSDGTPPLQISPSAALCGIAHEPEVASAQVKSALLLAGLYAEGETSVRERVPTRDHSELLLVAFGAAVTCRGGVVRLSPPTVALCAQDISVPADFSSAIFALVAASIAPDARVLVRDVNINPRRTGALSILRRMGAELELCNRSQVGVEERADIRVSSARLHGVEIAADPELVAAAIDEFPALLIAAACAEGETVLRGAEELRVKESDRIAAMVSALRLLGVVLEELPDGVRICGSAATAVFNAACIDSRGDHRIAMACALAGLRARGDIRITDCANVNTSYPGFVEQMSGLGLNISRTR